jgi:phytoene/squalene synthetase
LKNTIAQNNIPKAPFSRLLKAFKQDIEFQQSHTFDDIIQYCDNSANPVGELILYLFGEVDEHKIHYSNCICTALQLINF